METGIEEVSFRLTKMSIQGLKDKLIHRGLDVRDRRAGLETRLKDAIFNEIKVGEVRNIDEILLRTRENGAIHSQTESTNCGAPEG